MKSLKYKIELIIQDLTKEQQHLLNTTTHNNKTANGKLTILNYTIKRLKEVVQ